MKALAGLAFLTLSSLIIMFSWNGTMPVRDGREYDLAGCDNST